MAILKKKFFNVEIPQLNTTISALAYSIEQLNGRIIKLDLTRFLRGKNLEATFIIKFENNKAVAQFKSLKLMPQYIVRLMRNNVSYVEDSFDCQAKNAVIRMKPFMLTRKKVHRRIRKALRNKAREFIKEFCASKNSDDIFDEIISGALQKLLSAALKNIYPLALCEIRVTQAKC